MLKTKADNAKNPIFTAVVEKSGLRFFSMKNIFSLIISPKHLINILRILEKLIY